MRKVLSFVGTGLAVLALLIAWVIGFPFGDGLIKDAHGRTLFQQWLSDQFSSTEFAGCYSASASGIGDIAVIGGRDGDTLSGAIRASAPDGRETTGAFAANMTGRTTYRGSFVLPDRTLQVSGSYSSNELEVIFDGASPVFLKRC